MEMKSTREAYGDALVELARKNEKIVVLDADLSKSTYSDKFAQLFPERFIDCGVAEQSMMGTAAGLAVSGKICYTGSFVVFIIRALEHIRNSIANPNLNVKICATHAGITVGEDGSSHQTVEDIALMRAIPNMKVIVPADYYEAKSAVKAAAEIEGPVFIRLGRPTVPIIFDENYQFTLGKAVKLKEGKDATILAAGIMVKASLDAAEALSKEGIGVEVINLPSIKPLDVEAVLKSASKTGCVITAEEHSIIGGLGGAVAEVLGENLPTRMKRVGIQDMFGCSGSVPELLKHYGLTADDLVAATKEILK